MPVAPARAAVVAVALAIVTTLFAGGTARAADRRPDGLTGYAFDACRRSALRFLSGWTSQLHALGRRSGVYSSVSAGIHALDNADGLSPGSYEMPDQVWYAWYNGRADVDIASQWVRAGSWRGERVHQYEAQTTVVHGGVPLTIDRNFLELDGGSQAPRSVLACGRTRLDFPAYPRSGPAAAGTG